MREAPDTPPKPLDLQKREVLDNTLQGSIERMQGYIARIQAWQAKEIRTESDMDKGIGAAIRIKTYTKQVETHITGLERVQAYDPEPNSEPEAAQPAKKRGRPKKQEKGDD